MENQIDEKTKKEIIQFIEKNPIEMDYGNEEMSDKQIQEILKMGIDGYCEYLYENNIDYICELEREFTKYIYDHFNLKSIFDDKKTAIQYIENNLRDYYYFESNIKKILDQKIVAMLTVYSNYDCQTKFDNINDKTCYTGQVYSRLKNGIKKNDFLYEFSNMYHAGLIVFPFEISILDFFDYKEKFKTAKKIKILKDTVFGFLDGNYNGSGSIFEKKVYRNFIVNKKDSEYDCIGLNTDCELCYSIKEIYGQNDFFGKNEIPILIQG